MNKNTARLVTITDNFGRTMFNRWVYAPQVKKIKAAMLRGEYIPPILVNAKTGHIIDGQHRYEAYKELIAAGEDVELLVVFQEPKDEDEAAKLMNSTAKHWTIENYVEYNVRRGISGYDKLNEFLKSIPDGEKFYKAAFVLFHTSAEKVKRSQPIDDYSKLAMEVYEFMTRVKAITGIKEVARGESVKALMEVYKSVDNVIEFAKICKTLTNKNTTSTKSWRDYYNDALNKLYK